MANASSHSPGPGDVATSGAATAKGFRLDIQGIRGVAILLVLLCHAELPFAKGGFIGIDVFYVLSGFLITGLIVTEIERRGTISLLNFYARRAKRLLPAAAAVMGTVVVASVLVLPLVRQNEVAGDVIAASFYVINWRFIAEQVDYFAVESGAVSPLQHFWSLSVEEQFYIVWPIALLAVALVAFRTGWPIRRSLWLAVAPIGLVSLWLSLSQTSSHPETAYFSTLARGWELAAGAALMLALPRGLHLPRPVAVVGSTLGLATLVAAMALIDGADPYPGWRALPVVAATIAIIVAGTAVRTPGPIRLLMCAPMRYLGRISYSVYLWHWPAIVFAIAIWGPLDPLSLSLVTLASIPIAILSCHLLEERLRNAPRLERRPLRALALGLGCATIALSMAAGMRAAEPDIPTAPLASTPGATVIDPGTGLTASPALQLTAQALRPNPFDAEEDRGRMFEDGCLVLPPATTSPPCVYGDPGSDFTVVLLGDSHALQYGPSLERLASERGWRLIALMRANCVIADVDYKATCTEWLEAARRRIEAEKPDLVISSTATSSRYWVEMNGEPLSRVDSQSQLVEGFRRVQRWLIGTGAEAVVIRDQARTPFQVDDCVAEALDDLRRCAFRPARDRDLAFDLEGARRAGVSVIDPMPVLCPDHLCPAVIGSAIVYRDSYHLTATFATTLAPWLERRLGAARLGSRGPRSRSHA